MITPASPEFQSAMALVSEAVMRRRSAAMFSGGHRQELQFLADVVSSEAFELVSELAETSPATR